jgi:hypothetical protein
MELDVLKRSLCQGYLRYRYRLCIMLKDLAEKVFGAAVQRCAARRISGKSFWGRFTELCRKKKRPSEKFIKNIVIVL